MVIGGRNFQVYDNERKTNKSIRIGGDNMLYVNAKLYEPKNIYNFIEASITLIINSIPNLTSQKEYWLFYFIKDDFWANWSSLCNANIEQDFLGFPLLRKNTRHAVEAFLDLYNLCMDSEYMTVLKYCARQHKNSGKYTEYLFHNQFSIQSKCKIAIDMYSGERQFFEELVNISRKSNEYIHPNVFVDVISVNEQERKEQILKEMLNANFLLLTNAYKLILQRFYHSVQPQLSCLSCYVNGLCDQCYQMLCNNFNSIINDELLINTNWTPITFYNN